jgi:hypothetical protein
MNMRS